MVINIRLVKLRQTFAFVLGKDVPHDTSVQLSYMAFMITIKTTISVNGLYRFR